MRVLFLNHPEADYGEYFLYNGLCEVLGAENVWDVPYKRSYHGEVHHYAGYQSHDESAPVAALSGRGPAGVTAPFEFAKTRPGVERSGGEVLDACRTNAFDLVVVGSPRVEAVRQLKRLRPELHTDRIVMHDGEDYPDVWGQYAHMGVRLYLKRELLPGHGQLTAMRVKPFPFSCPIEGLSCDKTLDVLCAVGDSNPVRAAAKATVQAVAGANVLCGHWGWSRYIELIALSKIAVAPRGFGQDTVRRWEIPAFDTLLMCERLDLVEDRPLRDGEHCVYYSGMDDLRDKLIGWLARDEDRQRVAAAGRAFVTEHHTNRARAQRMLDWIREVYG